ncbi:MAG TPA: GNAT family N-acetyltransferase [Gaiellaceae bacterium]|nr:GNAT family N-acetyltransferase [Gaiellaceae bacterium]
MIELRSCADEREEQLSVDVYNAVWPHEAVTIDEVRHFKAAMVDHDDLVAWIDGEPGGSGFVAIMPQRPELPNVLITVLPEARGRGAGSGLYAAVSGWALERGLGELEVVVSDDDPGSLAFAQRRGFTEDRREKGVALRLADIEAPSVEPPEGIEILSWAERPDLAHGIYDVALEASPDVPGWEDEIVEPFEKWLVNDMQGSGDKPEATFLALADDEVVGYAKFSLSAAQPNAAWHDLTGIKRAWRGRGIARALKATQIRWAKEHGYEELKTRNDERNAPIRHLNREFGYVPTTGRIYLRGPLSER